MKFFSYPLSTKKVHKSRTLLSKKVSLEQILLKRNACA